MTKAGAWGRPAFCRDVFNLMRYCLDVFDAAGLFDIVPGVGLRHQDFVAHHSPAPGG